MRRMENPGVSLSPFKDEKTPSFSVRRESKSFYDFSSGIGGNVLTFVRYYYKCGYTEAIQKLKEYVGCTGEITPHQKLAAVQVAKRFSKPKTVTKFSKATALPDDYMERYEKRDDKLDVWRKEGISDASLTKFQVYYDSFSDRLVYPIRNLEGKIVNIGGRTLDPQWKEKKLRKYTYFMNWSGGMDIIYGLSENMKSIQEKREIILFEGCKSVLLADTWDVHNCGALLTSHLSNSQMKILARLGCKVVFALDKDVDILDDHNIKKLRSYVNVSYIFDREDLLEPKDSPADKGYEVFQKLYEQRFRYR